MSLFVNTVDVLGDEVLTNSIIDRSVTEIVDNTVVGLVNNALCGCTALKKVVLSSVETLGDSDNYAAGVFNSCNALEVADFSKLANMKNGTFSNCGALKTLILRADSVATLTHKNAIYGTPIANGTGYIYVPAALVDSYKTATNWSQYANQIRAIEDYPEVCDPYSWETVAKTIENGTYKDVYKIGDGIPVDLGSEGIINMQIAAFDADTLADGSGTAAISWVSKELLGTLRWVNPTREGSMGSYVEGTGGVGGWEKCALRSKLRDNIRPLVPEIVGGMIQPVTKGQKATDAWAGSFDQTTEDELWVPAKSEINANTSVYGVLFPDSDSLVKYRGGQANFWWLRDSSGASNFTSVSTSGSIGGTSSATAGGVCLGFCTGKSK